MMDEKEAIIEKEKQERELAEQRKREEEKVKSDRRAKGLCQHCGGTLKKGFIFTKCTSCGKSKDY